MVMMMAVTGAGQTNYRLWSYDLWWYRNAYIIIIIIIINYQNIIYKPTFCRDIWHGCHNCIMYPFYIQTASKNVPFLFFYFLNKSIKYELTLMISGIQHT